MGRYIHGTKGFCFKYAFARQPTNLSQLASWSGLEQQESRWSLHTQFFAPSSKENEEKWRFIDSVGWLTMVYEGPVPPFDLFDDVEGAIDQVCGNWSSVITGIDTTIPGVAINPDIAGGRCFTLYKSQWSQLALKIGHGADLEHPESLDEAEAIVRESGEDDHLPYLALRALRHALEHDLNILELVDESQRRSTNLWSVAEDYAGGYEPSDSWEKRLSYARMLSFQRRSATALPIYETLLAEHPEEIFPLRAIFAHHMMRDDWESVHRGADAHFPQVSNDELRAELFTWRGEAAWCLSRMDDTEADALAAQKLGNSALVDELNKVSRSQDGDQD